MGGDGRTVGQAIHGPWRRGQVPWRIRQRFGGGKPGLNLTGAAHSAMGGGSYRPEADGELHSPKRSLIYNAGG